MKYNTLDRTPSLSTEYLLDDAPLRIPRGDVTLLFGEGAAGKGRLTAWIIKQVTAAGGTVVGAWPEDNAMEQLRPRLEAAGLTEDEMSRVVNITRLPGAQRFKLSADLTHPGHVGLLRSEILPELKANGHDVKMLVLDPLAALIGWGSIQTNAGARRALEPLQDVCADTGIACLMIAHTVKSGQLQGSAGLIQAVRLAYRLTKDGEQRVITAEKSNNMPEMEELRFEIVSVGDNAMVRFLSNRDMEKRQMAWRTIVYTAGMTIVNKDGSTERRKLGTFTDLDEAKATCSAQPELAGPALEWNQHKRGDVVDLHVISAGVQRFGNMYGFAIRSTQPLTAATAA
jgi:hypothetical protein